MTLAQPPAPTTGLGYLAVEISWGSTWVDLNDHERYIISSDGTRDSVSKSYRKIVADSPILGGNYLVHAVPEMVAEQISIWVHGQDQTDLADNLLHVDQLFSQYAYRIRWTTDEYREYWTCQLADSVTSRNSVWTHSTMASATYTVPRYPNVTRERV
jgi:hypothetical protein